MSAHQHATKSIITEPSGDSSIPNPDHETDINPHTALGVNFLFSPRYLG